MVQPVLFREFVPSGRQGGKGLLYFARTVVCDRPDLAPHVERLVVDSHHDNGITYYKGDDSPYRAPLEDLKATIKREGLFGVLHAGEDPAATGEARGGGGPMRDGPLWSGHADDLGRFEVDHWLLVVLPPRLPGLRSLSLSSYYGLGGDLEAGLRPEPASRMAFVLPRLRRFEAWHGDTEFGLQLSDFSPLLRCGASSLEEIRLQACADLDLDFDLPACKTLYLSLSQIAGGRPLRQTFRHLPALEGFYYQHRMIESVMHKPWELVDAMVKSGMSRRLRHLHVDQTKFFNGFDAHTTYITLADDFPVLETLHLTAGDIFADAADEGQPFYWSDCEDEADQKTAFAVKKTHLARGRWLLEMIAPSVVEFRIYDAVPLREASNLAKGAPAKLPNLKRVLFGDIEHSLPGDGQEKKLIKDFADAGIECIFSSEGPDWDYHSF